MFVAACDLCEAVPFTTQYASDDICWIAECESCDLPMVVWRSHGIEPPVEQLEHMLDLLGAVAQEVLGQHLGVEWYIDRQMRQIPDHFHAHARIDRWKSPTSKQTPL